MSPISLYPRSYLRCVRVGFPVGTVFINSTTVDSLLFDSIMNRLIQVVLIVYHSVVIYTTRTLTDVHGHVLGPLA